jgi:hypothetical protein
VIDKKKSEKDIRDRLTDCKISKEIKEIIDRHLEVCVENGLNAHPGDIPKEMLDIKADNDQEWKTWVPIPSSVKDDEILELEKELGFKLPPSYISFLQHKHFIDLTIGEVSFFRHPSSGWQKSILDGVFHGYPREYLIDKGYMPFADFSDWGLMCFDLNRRNEDEECPIVLWDHEVVDSFEFKYDNFNEMLYVIGSDV